MSKISQKMDNLKEFFHNDGKIRKPDLTSVPREIKREDITPWLYAELEKEFYRNFQFNKLYEPAMEEGLFGKIVPYITFALSILIFLIVIVKK